ncbi:MAG TPA: imidazole glycerol phosphate synthase subunit HisH [Kofleriaceae bacterium]|jgi:glutamine amidotransferase|nr:imidazole glycerol phosphate synthase subunit HisH [Kofleriaceae bacterium]
MSGSIALVDVCGGNLRSVVRALEAAGGSVVVTSDPEVVRKADKVVVPGQGAFGTFAAGARDARGLGEALREVIARGTPFFGICLGMQVLFDDSEEQGPIAGLGFIAGHVVKFRVNDPKLKVPHIGWNSITRSHDREPLLEGLGDEPYAYFDHSYYAVPSDPSVIALACDYGGTFCAAVRKDNLFACQFHPEKSQRVGLTILRNFVRSGVEKA